LNYHLTSVYIVKVVFVVVDENRPVIWICLVLGDKINAAYGSKNVLKQNANGGCVVFNMNVRNVDRCDFGVCGYLLTDKISVNSVKVGVGGGVGVHFG
jgi:dTDP-glucose pyrophosphorylase